MAVRPGTMPLPPVSPYNSSNFSTSSAHQRSPGRVRQAAKAVAGLFIACLTPPEEDDDSHQLKSSAGSSGTRSEVEKKSGKARSYNSNVEGVANGNLTLAQIYKATKDFSSSLKLGQGGFGTVYRGTLEDGSLVAIKRAKRSDFDDHLGAEFQNELRTLTQVEHLNLVKLHGFVEDRGERIIVVEYVPNGTLRDHLDGKRGSALAMAVRLDIAIDVAHAITYLHVYTGIFEVCKRRSSNNHGSRVGNEPCECRSDRKGTRTSLQVPCSGKSKQANNATMCRGSVEHP